MCCKVFVFEHKSQGLIYINANDSSKLEPDIVLKLYVDWYNKEFAPSEVNAPIYVKDFKFVEAFHPIDFYDETTNYVRSL